jgi:hypothetical protein
MLMINIVRGQNREFPTVTTIKLTRLETVAAVSVAAKNAATTSHFVANFSMPFPLARVASSLCKGLNQDIERI